MTGITIIGEFISPAEEDGLLQHLTQGKGVGRSSIKRYGRKIYPTDIISETIPEYLLFIISRLRELGYDKDHVTINSYDVGGYIPHHKDKKESGETILIISLLSDADMEFAKKGEILKLFIPRRSLMIMGGEARHDYTHAVGPLTEPRFSIVFR